MDYPSAYLYCLDKVYFSLYNFNYLNYETLWYFHI